MKISRIEIEDFRQFKDFSLDLTYPQGHEKEGKPLDKVCFIGQSGTGKTSLLEIIGKINIKDNNFPPLELEVNEKISLQANSYGLSFPILDELSHKTYDLGTRLINETTINLQQKILQSLSDNHWGIISFPTEEFPDRPDNFPSKNTQKENISFFRAIISRKSSKKAWEDIKNLIVEFQEEISKFRFKISKKIEHGEIEESQLIAEELGEWRKKNPGILEDLSKNFLDPILSNFHLKVKHDLDSIKETQSLIITTLDGHKVLENLWSTGIKNIIYKILPLYSIRPTKHNIILIDEPENSLYPDIQTQIIEHYLRLAPESQFFFATHSPIIASSFEPWEIVELKFDQNGKVYREKHYEGENHVDNYLPDIRYLNYGQILKNIFDLQQEGGHREVKERGQMKLAKLREEIKQLNGLGNTEEAEKRFLVYREMAKKLDRM